MSEEQLIRDRTKGPFVLWQYYSYEGWQPESFDTLHAAVTAQKYQSIWIVTKSVGFQVVECT